MEVNQVSKGKSKGKNGKGKSSPKGKGKDKGESGNQKAKSKSQQYVAKVTQLHLPKVARRDNQSKLLQTDAITAVAMDTGSVIVASFRPTKFLDKFDKLRMKRLLNVQHQAQAVMEQFSTLQVRLHTVLLAM